MTAASGEPCGVPLQEVTGGAQPRGAHCKARDMRDGTMTRSGAPTPALAMNAPTGRRRVTLSVTTRGVRRT